MLIVLGARVAAAAPIDSGRSGRELYLAACAACHGEDGRGGTAAAAAYPRMPPDLTDCSFATREPNADWLAVTHLGGPARGFSWYMPAFDEALSPGEIERIVTYMRQFCRDRAWPRGELNLPRPMITTKAFPEDEAVLVMSVARSRVVAELSYETRIGARSQVEVVAPIVWAKQESGEWVGDLGDVALSGKRVFGHSLTRGQILSGALELIAPTGRSDRGTGSGTTVIEGFLAYGQLLPLRGFLQLQAGVGVPWDRDHPDEVFARGVLGGQYTPFQFGRILSPMVEVLSARELERGVATEVDLLPQLQVTLSARQHVRADVGVRIPLTDRAGRETAIMAYLLWDWFDGGLFEGW